MLNYGHTLGHALEIETGHGLAHGEAVAIRARLRRTPRPRAGRMTGDRVRQHYEVVGSSLNSTRRLPTGVDHERLIASMGKDKKALTGLTFVLDGEAGVEVVPDVPADAARRALVAMAGAGAGDGA